MSQPLLRQIRAIDYYLALPQTQRLVTASSREFVRDILRTLLESLREEILAQNLPPDIQLDLIIEERLTLAWQKSLTPSLRRVINATGILLHTNLGRAPLAPEAIAAITDLAAGYTNLEYELEAGRRGHRDKHCEKLLNTLLGSESAAIVNNNAAAVMLVLDELAQGGEAIISRGEMIEIGGAFRIPDVMQKSGAILKEVGTTNRTRLSDYEKAITPQTKVILRVHPSNYRIVGFTEKPSLTELVALCNKYNVILVEDLGSGCLVDLANNGIKDEPTVQASIAAGVHVVTFSGDKMLGGPQAGIIAGRSDYLTKIKRNPLMRALRVDKLCYAALEATLQLYHTGQAWDKVPILKALRADEASLMGRARQFLIKIKRKLPKDSRLTIKAIKGFSLMGGGSAPETPLPTALLSIESAQYSATVLEERLRKGTIPIIARIDQHLLLIDLRSILPQDEAVLINAIIALAQ